MPTGKIKWWSNEKCFSGTRIRRDVIVWKENISQKWFHIRLYACIRSYRYLFINSFIQLNFLLLSPKLFSILLIVPLCRLIARGISQASTLQPLWRACSHRGFKISIHSASIEGIITIQSVFYLTHWGRVTHYGDGSMLCKNPIFFTMKEFPQI